MGKLCYQARRKAVAEGGTVTVDDVNLIVEKADTVTFCVAAATKSVDDRNERIEATLAGLRGVSYETLKHQHLQSYQALFRRVSIDLGSSPNSNLQGIWNHKMDPSWDSNYTTNINTEMYYWPTQARAVTQKDITIFDRTVAMWRRLSDKTRKARVRIILLRK